MVYDILPRAAPRSGRVHKDRRRGQSIFKRQWYTASSCARAVGCGLGSAVSWAVGWTAGLWALGAVGVGWAGSWARGWAGLGWAGLGWAGWAGLGWLGWAGLGWAGLGWAGLLVAVGPLWLDWPELENALRARGF